MNQNTTMTDVCEMLIEGGLENMGKVFEILMNESMKLERAQALRALPYERNPERTGYANGFKDKTVHTRLGEVLLQIPQTRGIAFYPGSIEKGMRSERALKAAIAEMYIKGVSTRKVADITRQLCGFEVSSAQVSEIAKQLDGEINEFYNRPLGKYQYVCLDGRYEKVRRNGTILGMTIIWAVGIDYRGRRSVLGMSCKISEAEVHWRDFMESLVTRGLHGIKLIISDDHSGLKKARQAVFPTVPWQRCVFHMMRNAQKYVTRKAALKEVYDDLKDIFDASDLEQATEMKKRFIRKYEKSQKELAYWADTALEESLTYFTFPKSHRKKIKTTNLLERTNREIKRRTKVVSIFPNEEAAFRLAGAVLMEIHEEWMSGRNYLKTE